MHLIKQGEAQPERLRQFNAIAIEQMKLLTLDTGVKRLKGGK